MATGPSRTIRLLLATRSGRLAAFACCLLTLLATFDSLPLLQVTVGSPSPLSQTPAPSQEDDDDDMLDLTGSSAGLRASRRAVRPPSDAVSLRMACPKPCPLSSHPLKPPALPVRGQDNRNGIGAPLLC